jgi:putative transposase
VPLPLPCGAYFVTICTRDRACLFGEIANGEMRLNDAGEIARRCWEDIPHHFPFVELDAFVIMPNHMHGIIVITESRRGEKSFAPTYAHATTTTPQSPSRTIGSIVRGFKIAIQGKGEASVPPHVS